MSPRPYRLGKRQSGTEETRSRIIAATRAVLGEQRNLTEFSIDAIAERAGVARMTVYYQFKSKRGLLAGLLDDLAARGNLAQLQMVFQNPDSRQALDELVALFVHFYSSNRIVIRRLTALAALDEDVNEAIIERSGWRHEGLQTLLERLRAKDGNKHAAPLDEIVDVLHAMTSFEMFDQLAGDDRTVEDVRTILQRLVHTTLSAM
jgi:AcrR family transcriptional regulator